MPSVNSTIAIGRSRDKLRALQYLSAHDVGIPRTAIARTPEMIRGAVDAVGGTPVIIKLLRGTQGVGVMKAESAEGVESIIDTLWGLGQNIILQEFIAESMGRDLRAIVIGGELVAAMRRTAKKGEFRANLHRGGRPQRVQLPAEYARAALDAARIMGLGIAGVDLLESKDGPRVIEVNSSPGLRGVERATGVDVAQQNHRARRAAGAAAAHAMTSTLARNAAHLLPPGESGELQLAHDLVAHVIRGQRPGPVVWAWAPRGEGDPSMAQALGELRDRLSPRNMAGAVGLLLQGPPPPIAGESYPWADAIRTVTDGADGLVLLAGPPTPLVAAAHVALDVHDPAARKVARALGARFALPSSLPLSRSVILAPPVWWIDGESERLSRAVIDRAAAALGSLLGSLGITDDPVQRAEVRVIVKQVVTVETSGGVLEAVAHPGDIVERGQPIAYEGPPGARARRTVRAPVSGVVLTLPAAQSPGAGGITIGKVTRALPKLRAPRKDSDVFDIGWCERVAMPELGVTLRAKIDTGARSCALHVTSLRENRLRRRRQRARRRRAARRARPRARPARARRRVCPRQGFGGPHRAAPGNRDAPAHGRSWLARARDAHRSRRHALSHARRPHRPRAGHARASAAALPHGTLSNR